MALLQGGSSAAAAALARGLYAPFIFAGCAVTLLAGSTTGLAGLTDGVGAIARFAGTAGIAMNAAGSLFLRL